MMLRCFMGYDPEVGHEAEHFYVMRMYELTIYGHTVDAATRERFPEDWPLTLAGRERGMEFACWHSSACAEGEVGANPIEALAPISFEDFRKAAENHWPYLEDEGVTTTAPVVGLYHIEPDGTLVVDWDSLRGDT